MSLSKGSGLAICSESVEISLVFECCSSWFTPGLNYLTAEEVSLSFYLPVS